MDLFACSHSPIDIPFISPICTETGGDIYFFKTFNERYDSEKMMFDVFRILTRNNAYDVAFRVRCSEGYGVKAYYGSFIKRERIDFELCSIDADKTIAVELQCEGQAPIQRRLSLQFAMLYSTPDGQRRLRVMNLYLPLND